MSTETEETNEDIASAIGGFIDRLKNDLAEARNERDQLSRDLSSLLAGDCLDGHDAVEGTRNGIAMREAIKEAHDTIKDATDNCLWRSDSPIPLSAEQSQRLYNRAIETMENLQPFLP